MWFIDVVSDSRYYYTVRASLLQYVLSFSLAAAQLISMATPPVQLKIKTTQETVLHCNSSSVSNTTLLVSLGSTNVVSGSTSDGLVPVFPNLYPMSFIVLLNI